MAAPSKIISRRRGQSARIINAATETLERRTLLSAVSFAPPISLPTSGEPYTVVAADLTGDGKLDLIEADSGYSSINVFMGNGDGTFKPPETFATNDSPTSIVVTDLTHDGHADIVTANSSSDVLSVLLGNGDGTFQPYTTVQLNYGEYPHAIAAGDFNGDGNTDLVTGNSGDSVSILLGNGDGTFAAPTDVTVGQAPYSLAVGDFNGDGFTDIVTANRNYGYTGTLTLLRGKGNGTFKRPRTLDVGYDPTSVIAADVNGDGKLDLITSDYSDGTVSVLLSNGNGTFLPREIYSVQYSPSAVIAADLTGDGHLDLITFNSNYNSAGVLLGNGDGTFQSAQSYYVGNAPMGIVAGDFNGDHKTDLVVADSSDSELNLLLNDSGNSLPPLILSSNSAMFTTRSTGTFTITTAGEPAPALTETGALPTGVTFTDNGDGTATLSGKAASASAGVFDFTINADNGVGTEASQSFTLTVQRENQVFFTPNSPATAGKGPHQVVTADFNNDGTLDLVTVNTESNTVTLMLGNGDGTFQSPQTILTGCQPTAIAAADLTGDGDMDLIVADDYSSTIQVLLGNGNGTFNTSLPPIPVGNSPDSIAAAELTGDGKMDLVVANHYDNTVSVLLGNGDGTFQAPETYTVGGGPKSVVAADLNGDGKVDIATANYYDGTVSVLFGNGDGTFQYQQTFTVGNSPNSLIAANLTGTSKMDLVTADYADDAVSVLLNNGDGTFAPAETFATAYNPVSVVAADFDGDGNLDLATANRIYGAGTVSVLLGNGDGTFQMTQDFKVGSAPTTVIAGDFNGDHKTDLATSNYADNNVSVLLNSDYTSPKIISADGTNFGSESYGTFTFRTAGGPTPAITEAGALPAGVTFTDNGDGTATLTGEPAEGTVGVYPLTITAGNGIGANAEQQFTFDVVREIQVSPAYGGLTATTADLTGDGKSDLITANQSAGTVSVALNSGNGGFHKPKDYTVGTDPTSVIATDLTGDGKLDLVTTNNNYNGKGTISVLLGNGNGTFQSQMTFKVGSDPRSVVEADFGNGKADLAVANCADGTISILLGNGDGTFAAATTINVGTYPVSITAADVNGDGKMDLIVADEGSNDVAVLRGKGNGTFKKPKYFAVGNYPKSVVVADFNGDGKLDIATANSQDNTVSVLLGNGDGTFQNQLVFAVGCQPYAIAATEFTNDGDMDLVTANYGSDDVSALLGNGDGTFQSPLTFSVGSGPQSIAAADINGDGRESLVVGGYAAASVLLYIPTIVETSSGVVNVRGTTSYDTASVSMMSNGDIGVNIDGQFKSFAMGSVTGVNLKLGAGNKNAMIGPGVPASMVKTGAGSATITLANGGNNTLKGGKGDDVYLDAGTTEGNTIEGGSGLNFAVANPYDTTENVYQVINPVPPAPAANVVNHFAPVSAAPADTAITASVDDGVLTIKGTPDADDITVSSDGTHLLVRADGDNDGTFPIAGMTGILINGKAGNDTLSIASSVTLQATIKGNGGADSLTGGGGSNVLIGGFGNSTLVGGAGTNLLIPGKLKTYSDQPTDDLLIGGSGSNIADLSYRTDPLFLSNDGKDDSGDAALGEHLTISSNISAIWGGTADDTIVGTTKGEFLSGGSGANLVKGGGVSDILVGGSGFDSVAVAAEPVVLYLRNGNPNEYTGVRDPIEDLLEIDPGLDSLVSSFT